MTPKELTDRLLDHRIVCVSEQDWESLADSYEQIESHDTVVAGDLLIVRTDVGLAAVEQPRSGERVVRVLGGVDAVLPFVQGRLQLYERMWDGCGCKVDYYS